MALTLDTITLGAPDLHTARAFYTSVFSADPTGDEVDLHGTGRLALRPLGELAEEVGASPATSGFRGYVLSTIVGQPAEVEALLDAATANGAATVRPAKKKLFGEFAAVYRAPDGALWKPAAATRKNTGPAVTPIRPAETAVYLGVASPKASTAFYERVGMEVDRDYGDTFVDFAVTPGACRLGLLPRRSLAKDAGVEPDGDGFAGVVFTHAARSRDDLDAVLEAAVTAGGTVTAAEHRTGDGLHVASFADPDGFRWRITAPA
jgi:predicted lactoylglutathione lyase